MAAVGETVAVSVTLAPAVGVVVETASEVVVLVVELVVLELLELTTLLLQPAMANMPHIAAGIIAEQ